MSCAVILITQRKHGESLLEAAAHFTGDIPDVVNISLCGNESEGEIQSRLQKAIANCGVMDVVVLCDLFGSTHASITADIARRNKRVACVCGLNLTMLLEAPNACANKNAKQAAAQIAKAGRHAVVAINK